MQDVRDGLLKADPAGRDESDGVLQVGLGADVREEVTQTPLPETTAAWKLPYRGKVGMACLIIAESAIFTIFVVAYLYYVGKSLSGPTPGEVLETPIFYTICLLSSSLTIHFAGKLLERGRRGAFLTLWLVTIVGWQPAAGAHTPREQHRTTS